MARFSCPSTARTATTCPHDTATRYPGGTAVLRTPWASCHAPAHCAGGDVPPQSAASAAYGGDGLQAGAHRAPAGRDRVGAILHTEGVDGGPVRSEDIPCGHMGVRGFTEQWFRSPYATCFTASCVEARQPAVVRSVVSTVLTVTVDSCTHAVGTGAVRMRKWSRCREGAVTGVAEEWEDAVEVEWKRNWLRVDAPESLSITTAGRLMSEVFFIFWQCLPLC